MAAYARAQVIRDSMLEPFAPPKHLATESFTLIGEALGAEKFALFLTEIHPGGEAQTDTHDGCEHCYYILAGTGEACVSDETFALHAGDCLWIPPDARHGIKPTGKNTLRFLVVTAPPPRLSG